VSAERKLTDMVQWTDIPPELHVIRAPVLSPKPTCSHRLVIACDGYAMTDTHFVRKRTTACIGRDNGCEGCLNHERKVRKLYLGVWWPEQDRMWLAELPDGAIRMAWLDLKRLDGRLRGNVLLLSRPSVHKNGRVHAHVRGMTALERAEQWRIPPAFNLRETLAQVWTNLRDVLPPRPAERRA
jgi:hypothetical protein